MHTPDEIKMAMSFRECLARVAHTPEDLGLQSLGGMSEAQVDARVTAGIASWVGAAPGALDTLAEIATALGDDQTAIDGLTSAIAGKSDTGHTHAQSDVTNLVSDLAGKASTSHNHDGIYQPISTVLTNTTAAFTVAQETKLSGIATGATANSSDATLLARANHTGTQTAATISDFSTATDARIAAASVNTLSDVTVTTPSVGQVLKWNGSAWVNGTDSTSAGGAAGYTIAVQALTSSPADGQTIYFGTLPKAPITTSGVSKVYFRATGVIKRAEIYCYSGTAGTSESWSLYIRKNNTTDTLIATVAAAASERVFTNATLNIAVASGDYIEIKAVNPTWVTNPLTTIFGGYIYIENA